MPPTLASILIALFIRCLVPAQATKATGTCSQEKAVAIPVSAGVDLADLLQREAVQLPITTAVQLVQMGAQRAQQHPKMQPLPHHSSKKVSQSWQDKVLEEMLKPGRVDKDGECTIASSSFDWGVQLLLFLACMGSLLLKWHLEDPQRRLITFALDVSQQVCAAGLYHLLNMLFAAFLSDALGDHADACAMYWISFVIDTSIGTFFTCFLLWTSRRYLGYKSGNYYCADENDDPGQEAKMENFDANKWARQILAFCGIVCTSKAMTSSLVFSALPFWSSIGIACTEWIRNPQLRLLWVMMITPAVMDTLTFWITDEFIKDK